MRELTTPVDLCRGGALNPEAVGWSRTPLHRCAVDGPWGRRKRWHHWCVTSPREVVALTLADLDYLHLAVTAVVDRASGRVTRDTFVRPLGLRAPLPETATAGEVAAGPLRFTDDGARVRLVAAGIDLTVERPPALPSLSVAVDWGHGHFAYSSKQPGLPARGTVHGQPLAEGALACLDWGRGVWPLTSRWNWACAMGPGLSLNLGAQWANENAVIARDVLTKLGDVAFEWNREDPRAPWRIHAPEVELTVAPEAVQDVAVPGLGRLCLVYGTFRGHAGGVDVPPTFGWAEELKVRW